MNKQTNYKQTEIGEIPEDWEVNTLSNFSVEIVDGDRGLNYPKQGELLPDGYCLFLSTKNVPSDNFDFSEKFFVTEDKDKLLRKGKLHREDIVLTTRGTVGNIALFDKKVPYNNIRINSMIHGSRKQFLRLLSALREMTCQCLDQIVIFVSIG